MLSASIDWNSEETLKDFADRCISQGLMPLDIDLAPFPQCWLDLYRESNDGKVGSKEDIVAWFQAKLRDEFSEKRSWRQTTA
jgi:hypothetical protein